MHIVEVLTNGLDRKGYRVNLLHYGLFWRGVTKLVFWRYVRSLNRCCWWWQSTHTGEGVYLICIPWGFLQWAEQERISGDSAPARAGPSDSSIDAATTGSSIINNTPLDSITKGAASPDLPMSRPAVSENLFPTLPILLESGIEPFGT